MKSAYASRAPPTHPSKDRSGERGRDARKGAHNDSSTDRTKVEEILFENSRVIVESSQDGPIATIERGDELDVTDPLPPSTLRALRDVGNVQSTVGWL